MNKYEVALAGLLHDIGKFSQRSFEWRDGLSTDMESELCPKNKDDRYTHLHVLYTNEFCDKYLTYLPDGIDKNVVNNLASYHHKPQDDKWQKIIQSADHFSAGMEREEKEAEDTPGRTAFRTTRLKSIMSEIDIGKGKSPLEYVHHIGQLHPSNAFPLPADSSKLATPQGKPLTAEYRNLWDEFVKKWQENKVGDKWGYVARAVSILEKFTWCIPSDTTSNPDISLFDHLKTTSAIAVCMADENANPENPFLLVAGAFGGIQRYIFDIKKGIGGLARRLRSRSLFVAILSESVAFNILKKLDVPISNCILSAGGKFQLLLPNTEATLKVLNETRAYLDDWTMKNFNGDIHLALAWEPFAGGGFQEFNKVMERVLHKLDEEKRRPFRTVLQRSDGWRSDKFVLPYPISSEGEEICDFCNKKGGKKRTIKEEEVHVCDNCGADYNMGAQLPKEKYIAFYLDDKGQRILPYGSFSLTDSLKGLGKSFLVVDMDGDAEGDEYLPLYARRVCRHVPRDADGDTMLFEDIVKHAKGRQALGYLKADVDNLGTIFRKGFEQGGHKVSISRVASLSRMLDLFFSSHLENLLKEHDFNKIYMVYSGGDDLLCLGPWDMVFDFAKKLREDFKSYTAENPSWSLSAGVVITHSKMPVDNAVKFAEEKLESSKKEHNKDSITALGCSMGWETFPDVLSKSKMVLNWIEEEVINVSKVQRLLRYGRMFKAFLDTGDTYNLRFVPLLAYDIRRNWRGDKDEEEEKKDGEKAKAVAFANNLKNIIKNPDLDNLEFITQYALYGVREKED